MSMMKPTRRALMAATAVAAVAPPLTARAAQNGSAIASLWAEAESLKLALKAHAAEIAAAEAQGGIPGWMRLSGEANALGNRRYQALSKLLNAQPSDTADVLLMHKAAQDAEMRNGPRSWALAQVSAAATAIG